MLDGGSSSINGSAYIAAKGGIIALTANSRSGIGPHGITCNAIAPGITLTERIAAVLGAHQSQKRQGDPRQHPVGQAAQGRGSERV
ncbi:MAG: SDR family NAD(P)-dependent oxidoreductase [Caldilineaceae bacterium]